MRWNLRRAAIASLLVAIVAGCSTTTPSSTSTSSTAPSFGSTSTTGPPITANAANTPTTIAPAGHVGTTVSIPAGDQSPPATVTLLQVVDPGLVPNNSLGNPVNGDRFVGVQLQIVFGGTSPASLDAAGDTTLVDTQGNVNSPTNASLTNCPSFNTAPIVQPGKTIVGCVDFELGPNTSASQITFTPNGQFGQVSAQWQVP